MGWHRLLTLDFFYKVNEPTCNFHSDLSQVDLFFIYFGCRAIWILTPLSITVSEFIRCFSLIHRFVSFWLSYLLALLHALSATIRYAVWAVVLLWYADECHFQVSGASFHILWYVFVTSLQDGDRQVNCSEVIKVHV